MTDFLQLMVAEFQNQSIDDTADTSDMLNQLVQMQMIQAITEITDAATTMYAGSLVGKEVTIGQYDSNGNLQGVVGTVTGTGSSNGSQVVFVNGESYSLSDILAIGRLPESKTVTTAG
jgi:flagellar basal-body rod modification protein FlgD